MKSLMYTENLRECYACGTIGHTEGHHVFYGTANRQQAERMKLKVRLCQICHRESPTGIHGGNKYLIARLRREAQAIYELTHTRQEFYGLIGKYYLEEDTEVNQVVLMSRLTRDPETRHTEANMAITRYTIAVERKEKRQQDKPTADFINIVAFDKAGEFAEKHFRQGMRVLISGRIQTGSYTNRDGQKVYTTDVIARDQEFADSKSSGPAAGAPIGEGFTTIEEGLHEPPPFS